MQGGRGAFLAPPPALRGARGARRGACAARWRAVAADAGTRVRGVTFELTKTVLPADSDYSGALWHGAYLRWLEEARVRYLAAIGIDYARIVADLRLELVVSSVAVRYARPARLGDTVTVRQRFDVDKSSRVRIVTVSDFFLHAPSGDPEGKAIASSEVSVTPVNMDTGRPVRKWPPLFEDSMRKLFEGDGSEAGELPSWLKK